MVTGQPGSGWNWSWNLLPFKLWCSASDLTNFVNPRQPTVVLHWKPGYCSVSSRVRPASSRGVVIVWRGAAEACRSCSQNACSRKRWVSALMPVQNKGEAIIMQSLQHTQPSGCQSILVINLLVMTSFLTNQWKLNDILCEWTAGQSHHSPCWDHSSHRLWTLSLWWLWWSWGSGSVLNTENRWYRMERGGGAARVHMRTRVVNEDREKRFIRKTTPKLGTRAK